jgi:CheY-like chemotaxis protein
VVLADRGAKVRLATNVETALLRMDEAWPDVLLSDIGLPRRDGYELIREVRALPPPKDKPRLPAIALTAFARAEDRAKAIDAGFDDHVPKPLNPHALVLAIRALLLTQQLSHRR